MILNGKHRWGVLKNSLTVRYILKKKDTCHGLVMYIITIIKAWLEVKKKADIFFYRCHDVKIFPRVFLKYAILNNKIRVCEAKFVHVYMYVAYLHKNR